MRIRLVGLAVLTVVVRSLLAYPPAAASTATPLIPTPTPPQVATPVLCSVRCESDRECGGSSHCDRSSCFEV